MKNYLEPLVLGTQKMKNLMLVVKTGLVQSGIAVIHQQRFGGIDSHFLPNLNALAPNFHVAGGQYAGVNCEAGGGPYGGGPYFGGTGCMVQSTSNDVAASYDSTDWRLGLDYDVSDNAFVYGYVATGFKSGSITDVYVRGETTLHPEGPGSVVNTSYGPEEAITAEIGYKGRFLNNTLNFSANYYFTEYDGKQFTGNVPVDVVTATEYN